ncbi:hypothetical protein DPMN_052335 [Dreissena polymorpha]|uniref:Uncharacterized protein n=1 Tax=Dreissena polymorpha TaxID=45954 RepID=A0A9D4CJI2_DREPO|nr:hypothetical protein DPMN_052335 [Dreissena polymorpha]
MLKLAQTNQQTNQQTGQKQYVPHYYREDAGRWLKFIRWPRSREKCPAPWQVLTRKNAPLPDGHVFQPTGIIFELVQDIIGMNLLTKFHEDWTINVASRVKNTLPLGSHVFQAKVTIFKLIQDNIGTNLLSKFHEDRKINVASRVLTRKNAPLPGSYVF